MSNAMWGGRFESGPAAIMEEINASVEFDQALWRQDIAGSRAHVKMLAQQGIVTETDCVAILKGLDAVAQEIESGQFAFTRALEDVHMNVESRLSALIGAPAGRLHTARSRNDQVATDMRLWVRDTLDALDVQMRDLQTVLAEGARPCRLRHARFHPFAISPTRNIRASFDGLCRNAGPRPEPSQRCPRAHE